MDENRGYKNGTAGPWSVHHRSCPAHQTIDSWLRRRALVQSNKVLAPRCAMFSLDSPHEYDMLCLYHKQFMNHSY